MSTYRYFERSELARLKSRITQNRFPVAELNRIHETISEQMFIDMARNSYSHFLQARAFAGISGQSTLTLNPRARGDR